MEIGERIRERRLLRGWSIRHAADRAGISHASWSRIERGLQALDNRFVLAGIATALECSPADLSGTPSPAGDRRLAAARAGVPALRRALIDAGLPADTPPAATPDRLRVALVRALRHRCDYAGAVAQLPGLIRDLHAATAGPDRRMALRLLCEVTSGAATVLRSLGYPADAWLGADRCRDAAIATEDPVLLGLAAYARAGAALNCGSVARGRTLAADGVRDLQDHLAAPGAAAITGALALTVAYASRCLGHPDDSAGYADEARRMARHTGEAIVHGLYFGPANVNLWLLWIELNDGAPGRALEIASAVDVTALPHSSRVVYFHTDVARARAELAGGEPDAVRHLMIAERLAPQHVHACPVARETTRILLGRAGRQPASSALRGLGERMRIA